MPEFDPKMTYDEFTPIVNEMVADRERHEAEMPGCKAAPLCLGPGAMLSLALTGSDDPIFHLNALLVAIGELSKARKATADLNVLADGLTEENADLKLRCQRLQDEVDAYESVADMLGPVGVELPTMHFGPNS